MGRLELWTLILTPSLTISALGLVKIWCKVTKTFCLGCHNGQQPEISGMQKCFIRLLALSEFRNAFNWSTQKLGHLSVSPPVKMLHHEGPCRSLPLFQPICSNVAQCPIVGMSQLRLQYGQWVTDYWPYNNTKIIFTNHNTYSEVFFYK